MKTYKCIKVNRHFQSNNKSSNEAVDSYESLLNSMAQEGWQLDNIDHITREIPSGCLSALFGGKPTIIEDTFYIFSKEV